MKLPKQPKKFLTPHQKSKIEHYYTPQRPKQKKQDYHTVKPIVSDTVDNTDKSQYIMLDDERTPPQGWTLTKSPYEFWKLLDGYDENDIKSTIVALALDWYLGNGVTDGVAVAQKLAAHFYDDPDYLPKLERIYFQSSDHDKAREMMNIVKAGLVKHNRNTVYFVLDKPVSTVKYF